MKIIAIGGGASSMMFATQYKKLNPQDDVKVFEKTQFVSWAGCPSPYYIMDELPEKKVTGANADTFIIKGIDVKINHFVDKINFNEKYIISNNEKYYYDKLILGLGAKPNLEIKKDKYFSLSHAVDAIEIKNFLKENKPKNVVVIGLGFIGLEMVEAFVKYNMNVTIIEKSDDIFPILPLEFRNKIKEYLNNDKVNLITSTSVKEFNDDNIILENNHCISFDMLLLSTGIKGNIDFIKDEIDNIDNKIIVNTNFETNIKDVYAIGDCIYNKNILTNDNVYAPFGDVANKHGIMLAKYLSNKNNNFKGVIRSFASSYHDIKFAGCGLTLLEAKKLGINADIVSMEILTKNSGFENSKPGIGQIIYDVDNKIVLGGFMLGYEAIAQFIDQISIVTTFKIPIEEFINIDFAYSPTNASVWNPLLVLYRKVIK